jgi:hypothetical protein
LLQSRPLAPQADLPDGDRLLRKRICPMETACSASGSARSSPPIKPLCLSEYRSSVARHVRHGRMTTSGMSYWQEVSPGREASPGDPCARRKLHFEERGEEIEPLGRAPRLQDVQGLLTTRGRHASCGIAQDDGGVSPRAEDRQWHGEVAASHPLRGGSLDPNPHRWHPASRRPGRDDREGADAASRFMNAALVALKETGTGACPNPVFGTVCGVRLRRAKGDRLLRKRICPM